MAELTDEQLIALRDTHVEKYGQYCDNTDFLMVVREVIAASRQLVEGGGAPVPAAPGPGASP